MTFKIALKSAVPASLLVLGTFLAPMAAFDDDGKGSGGDGQSDGRGDRVRGMPGRAPLPGAVVLGNGINYHGGPVMHGAPSDGKIHVYYIWYGNWGAAFTSASAILTDLASNIGGSPYFNINTTYGDTTGNVPNAVAFAGSVTDTGSLGTSLTDANIFTIVTNSIGTGVGKLPKDPDAVYFVLTAPGVKETSGFLTQYCGWHTSGTLGTTAIKYAFVGDAVGPSFASCSVQTVSSPNGDPGPDAMASVISHELEEAASDPQLNAWWDATGQENADKCAWTFGTTFAAPNGSSANMTLGTRNFLIQRNWLNAGGGSCALSLSTTPDFSVSVSASQTVPQGGTSLNYTLTATPLNGFTGAVSWTITPPAGITASTVSGSPFTLTALSTLPPGTYAIPITGTSGTLTHSTSATLVVTSNANFTLSISPSSRTVTRPRNGSVTTTYTVTVTPSGTFASPVALTVTGGITGITPALSPTSITAPTTSTLTVTVTSNSQRTSRTLTVRGTSGTLTKTATATIVVQ